MYHEITYKQQRRTVQRRVVAILLIVVMAVAIVFIVRGAQANAREQAVVSVRESVLNAAKQCCAVEGSYPS